MSSTTAPGATKATGNQLISWMTSTVRLAGRRRWWRWWADRTSASRRWSTASWAGARPSSRMSPGVTRDRVSYDALWTGRRFLVQDTGGWEPDAKGLQQLVAEQAAVAMRTADAVILVVDAVVGATAGDEAAARILRRSGKPVFLAANKVDSERDESDAAALWSLGLGEPYAISAMHGRGVADLLDAVVGALPEVAEVASPQRWSAAGGAGRQAERRKELAAEPAGRRRAVGGPRSRGHHGRSGGFADRNGRQGLAFRRHRRIAPQGRPGQRPRVLRLGAHTRRHRCRRSGDRADRRVGTADRAGPAGAVDGHRGRTSAGLGVQQMGSGRRGPPLPAGQRDRPRTGAGTLGAAGQHLRQDRPGGAEARTGHGKRVGSRGTPGSAPVGSTPGSRKWWPPTPPPVRGGKQPRILFATQATARPPTFVLFTTGFLEAGYRRFLERRLRETFGFDGSPIRINVRVREKRGTKSR